MKDFQGIEDYRYLSEALMIDDIPLDSYGERVGVVDKSDSASNSKLEQPVEGPIGDIKKSAYANVNVSTRGIPRTDNGNLGCAAATSIMFYRGTGYSIVPGKKIELSTGAMWDYLVNASDRFRKIDNWKTDYQPGDIIITKRGSRPGHVGIVVDNGKVMSNSSGGFQGDQKGQIELNYTISGWQRVADRNPTKTALFRYIGPYRKVWGGEGSNQPDNSGTTVTDQEELAYGSTGSKVVNLQMALINSGYDLPKYGADGKFFAETRGALKRFQKDKGIPETGVLDKTTSDALLGSESADSPSTGTDLTGKRFKIFDLKKRRIVIAKVEADQTITIKTRSGERIGSAKRDGDKITLEYDGETMEATSDSDNRVAKSIFNIYKRMGKPSTTQTSNTQTGTSGSGEFISISSAGDKDLVAQKGAQIANRLTRDLGLTKEQAAGVVGNLWAESGLIPDRIQGAGTKRGTISQAGGGGYAWAQYTSQNLKDDFITHARSRGIDITRTPATDDVNYSYLTQWIKGSGSRFNSLKSQRTTRNSAEYFVRNFEKPYKILYGSPAEQQQVISTRTEYANLVLSKMGGTQIPDDQNQPLLAGKPKVLFLGDSQTAASYSYANELIKSGEVTGKVVATPGASTYVIRDMLRDEMLKIGSTGEKYDAVSIMAGGNDAWRDQPTAAIENLKAMYQTIKNAGMKVIALSNPTKQLIDNPKKYPSNEMIASWVESGGDGLIDAVVPVNSKTKSSLSAFGPDRIHLSGPGHAIVKSLWKNSVGTSNIA